MKASELAFKAAGLMAERGHCKFFLEDGEGRVCFNGALLLTQEGVNHLRELSGRPWLDVRFDSAAHRVAVTAAWILDRRGLRKTGPVRYNNDPQVSGEDVILLLKEAGGLLREQEAAGNSLTGIDIPA